MNLQDHFQVNRKMQEEFVNAIVTTMRTVTSEEQKEVKATGVPYNPVTGSEFSGANMVRLLFESVAQGYDDNRWMTFKELNRFQDAHPELDIHIRKGERGIQVMRPEEISFIMDEGRTTIISREQAKEFEKIDDFYVPDVHQMILFYPCTVFNATQIEGFPAKEYLEHEETSKNEFITSMIASSGIAVEHCDYFQRTEVDGVKMRYSEMFASNDEYCSTKLREFFYATGQESRENRHNAPVMDGNANIYSQEGIRADLFSMMANTHLGLPLSTETQASERYWEKEPVDVEAVFRAANEAAKIFTVMHQYECGEQPKAAWFSPRSEWSALIEVQAERDKQSTQSISDTPTASRRMKI